jgi:hypothetical protein
MTLENKKERNKKKRYFEIPFTRFCGVGGRWRGG